MVKPHGLLIAVLVLFALVPSSAQARRVTVRIQPVDQSGAETGARLEQRVHVTLPDTGHVKFSGRRRVWVSGRCHLYLTAESFEKRDISIGPGDWVLRRLRDPYADAPVIYVFANSTGCPGGVARPVLASAAIDNYVPPCGADGKTIVANAAIRVYRFRSWMVMCSRATRHRTDLGQLLSPSNLCAPGGCWVDLPTLAGHLVAYADEESIPRSSSYALVIREAPTGRVVRRAQAGSTCSSGSDEAGPVRTIALQSDGAVTWTVDACVGVSPGIETHSRPALPRARQ
jgi:hypothetical protein